MMYIDILLRLGAVANSLSISASEIVLGLLILLAIYKTYKTRDYSVFKKGFFLFFLLMIVAETISTFAGIDPERSMKGFTTWWVLLYLPAIYIVFQGRDRVKYFVYVFLGAVIASVYGVYELLNGDVRRADGFFSHALTYGNVIALVAIAAFGVLLYRLYETKNHFYITSVTLVLTIVALLVSGSRGPILAFIITAFMVFIFRFKVKGFITGILLLIILVSVAYKVPHIQQRFTNIADNAKVTTSSVGTRLVLWEASSRAIMLRPFFGYGKNNFRDNIGEFIDVPTSSRAHAHNSYIQYTYLHGFFGLFAMLGFLGSILWEIKRKMRDNPFMKVAMSVIVVFMLEGLTENNFTDSEVAIMCFSLVGMMLAPRRSESIPDDSAELAT